MMANRKHADVMVFVSKPAPDNISEWVDISVQTLHALHLIYMLQDLVL